MPKVIQMPRRPKPQNEDRTLRNSMILPDSSEESESLSKVQRWLEIGDSALENKSAPHQKRPLRCLPRRPAVHPHRAFCLLGRSIYGVLLFGAIQYFSYLPHSVDPA